MDYEKKYKEALERAKDWFSNGEPTEHTKSIIFDLFPEIKESEEKKNLEIIIGCIPDESLRIWLENQQKEKLILKDQIESLQAALVAKDKTWEARMAKQKPIEWREKDEKIRKAIIHSLDRAFTHNSTIYEMNKEQCLAWLEKQKPVETQSQWKPTIEQVETLYETLDSNKLIQDKEYNILSSLCKDLRKLQYE